MTAECGNPDDMTATTAAGRSSKQLCRYYTRYGTCPARSCRLSHSQLPGSGVEAQASRYERLWSLSSTEEDASDAAAGQQQQQQQQHSWRFSVASYNILADKYARHYRSYLYHEVPSTYLDWHHRRAAILTELAHLLPDVICLQEVDRYEDLEEELAHLGYSGIFLQRDGGRRDGCATFWRTSLLRPAVVRQVRFSHHDLKDNVALLVLFEPCTQHSTAQHAAALLPPSAAPAVGGAQQQQQRDEQMSGVVQDDTSASVQQQQQRLDETLEQLEQQQQYGQSPQQQQQQPGVLSQWLPKGWLWSNSSNSSSSHHARSSQLLLRPVHPSRSQSLSHSHSQADVAGSPPGVVYQVPAQLPALQQQQQQQQQQVSTGGSRRSFEAAAATSKHRRSSSSSSSSSRRRLLERQVQQLQQQQGAAAGDGEAPGSGSALQQQQQPPDWVRCGLLVANTHIIFTPDKGEVKLGQARLLVQEVGQMAAWYLQQQQQQGAVSTAAANGHGSSSRSAVWAASSSPSAAGTAAAGEGNNGSGSSGSEDACGSVVSTGMQAVAAILTGDFNATPNSPLYAYLSQGLLDLQTVNKRNVSHMVGGSSSSSSHHHKGYRGYRRANRRRSVELQQQTQQQTQQQDRQQSAAATVAAASAASSAAVDIPTRDGSSSSNGMQRQHSSGSTGGQQSPLLGSSPAQPSAAAAATATASSPMQRQNSSGNSSRQYKWSDREVKRAAGMSYDELVEASLSLLSSTQSSSEGESSVSADASCEEEQSQIISRAADAFGASAAEGAGAAAAATAAAVAAAAAAAPGRQQQQQRSGVTGFFATATTAMSRAGQLAPGEEQRQPLLLQHGLKLQSSYKSVLGQEPDYTSSHSQFMDTCDYIWYTSNPLLGSNARQPGADNSGSSSSSGSGPYELRPVAVLQPPDGLSLNKGLPSKALGSDHICLLTDFELVLRQA